MVTRITIHQASGHPIEVTITNGEFRVEGKGPIEVQAGRLLAVILEELAL